MNRFVIADPDKCTGCYTCVAACVNEHEKVGLVAHPRLTVIHTATVTMPVQCRNCDDAPCEKVCPVTAITFQDHAVQINESLCIGCKMCSLACPFGAITPFGTLPEGAGHPVYGGLAEPIDHDPEPVHPILAWAAGQKAVAVKCDMCHFLPEGPACIRVCPTEALRLVDDAALNQSAADKRAKYSGMLAAVHAPGVASNR
jgi:hydrogenase-4 component A